MTTTSNNAYILFNLHVIASTWGFLICIYLSYIVIPILPNKKLLLINSFFHQYSGEML